MHLALSALVLKKTSVALTKVLPRFSSRNKWEKRNVYFSFIQVPARDDYILGTTYTGRPNRVTMCGSATDLKRKREVE